MASAIDYVPCPKCEKEATEIVNFRRGTTLIVCDHCGFSNRPVPECQSEEEPE